MTRKQWQRETLRAAELSFLGRVLPKVFFHKRIQWAGNDGYHGLRSKVGSLRPSEGRVHHIRHTIWSRPSSRQPESFWTRQ